MTLTPDQQDRADELIAEGVEPLEAEERAKGTFRKVEPPTGEYRLLPDSGSDQVHWPSGYALVGDPEGAGMTYCVPATTRLRGVMRAMNEEADQEDGFGYPSHAAALRHYRAMLEEILEQLVEEGMVEEEVALCLHK